MILHLFEVLTKRKGQPGSTARGPMPSRPLTAIPSSHPARLFAAPSPPGSRTSAIFVLTFLVRDRAGRFAGGLAGSLAFAATTLDRGLFQVRFVQCLDVIHQSILPNHRMYSYYSIICRCIQLFPAFFCIDSHNAAQCGKTQRNRQLHDADGAETAAMDRLTEQPKRQKQQRAAAQAHQ